MKSRILRRAGALLLALSLTCSILTLPAAAELTGLTISANHPEIEPGEETILTLSGAPNNADIAWSSDNTQVLPVPANASGSTCTLTAGTVTKRTEVQITATVTTISSGGSGDGSGDSSGDGSGGGSGTARDSGSVSYTVTVTPPRSRNFYSPGSDQRLPPHRGKPHSQRRRHRLGRRGYASELGPLRPAEIPPESKPL